MDLQDAAAIVTGASSGIGAACARQLAEAGCHLVVNYLNNEEGAQGTAAACRAFGVQAEVIRGDVAEDADCRKLAAAADAHWGRLDGLVSNAGITRFCEHENLDGLDKQDFLDLYSVNVLGAYQMARAVAPLMRRGGRGSIVNVASIAGILGTGSSIAYAASKGALITLGRYLARVLGPEIRINTVCPGFVQGDWMKAGLGEEKYRLVLAHLERVAPLRQIATADAVAEAVLCLLTGAGLATGETLILDGGHHLLPATPFQPR